MRLSINNKYKIMQGLFWMMVCVGTGFISLYLQNRGITTVGIGIIIAIFGILAAVIQPILGRICDDNPRFTWKRITIILSVIFTILCFIMPLVPGKWSGAVFMGMLMMLSNIILPFINSAHFYYTQKGKYINFGVARGIGSGLYAILALVIGVLAEKYGAEAVPVCGIVVAIIFIILTLRMPMESQPVDALENQKPEQVQEAIKGKAQKPFLLKYPMFAIMMLASLMMITSHNVTTTYLLQIIQFLGGDSSQLGIVLAIQAIVEVPMLFGFSKLIKHFRPASLMLISAVGYAVKAVLHAMSNSILMLYFTQSTQIFTFAIFASASVYYTSVTVAQEDQITGQAWMCSMISAGTVLGSLIGGWSLQIAGIDTMLSINIIIVLFGVGFALISARPKHKPIIEQ